MDNTVKHRGRLSMTRNEIYKRIWKLLDEASSNPLNRRQIEIEVKSLYRLLKEGKV